MKCLELWFFEELHPTIIIHVVMPLVSVNTGKRNDSLLPIFPGASFPEQKLQIFLLQCYHIFMFPLPSGSLSGTATRYCGSFTRLLLVLTVANYPPCGPIQKPGSYPSFLLEITLMPKNQSSQVCPNASPTWVNFPGPCCTLKPYLQFFLLRGSKLCF